MMREIFPNIGTQQTLEEVLKAIDCDFTAEQVPVHQELPNSTVERVFEEIPGYSVVRRGDNKIALGVHSARYGLTQYKETLAFLNDIAGQNQVTFQSATSIDNGARVYIAMKAPNTVVFAPGDEIQCYYTAGTSHDGTGSIELMCSPVHTKSQTILTTLDSGIIRMRHTAKVKDRLARASGTINKMNEIWSRHADKFTKFCNLPVSDLDARAYFALVVPSDVEPVHTRTQNVRDKMFDIYKAGMTSNLPSCQGTLLGCFVAALIFGDYYKTVRKSIIGRTEHDIMVESRLSGTSARFKADAFHAALKMARL